MSFNTAESLALISLLLTFAITGWGIIRYFLSQIGKVYSAMNEQEKEFRKELNHIHDSYVKRDDLNNHIGRIDKGIVQLNTRFDQLITFFMEEKRNGK